MPKSRRYEQIIFEEPLIDISMQPTEEVDPLFIDPTAESFNNEVEDDLAFNGFSIFSPKNNTNKPKQNKSTPPEIEGIKIKEEKEDEEVIKVKEEPKDPEEAFEAEQTHEEEIDPVEALAQALNKVEFLCPKCIFRSPDKEEVRQHFLSSHRVCQIGIPRPCDKCDFIAKTVRELAAHKKQSHPRATIADNLPTLPTGEFKCPHCDFTSFHKNNVRSHTRVHSKDIVYTCDKCPYTAISRINIENHAARHLVKSRRKWKFKCKHCGLLERTEKLLQRHLILHGEGEMLKCQLCSYKSPYNHIISMHTRICHGIVGKKSWDREEKWKRRVRQSTRTCARERKSYTEENNDDIEKDNFKEEFLELPIRKSNRGRKKRICDKVEKQADTVEENVKQESTDAIKLEDEVAEKENTEQVDIPRRPTLEERLGRARELINKNLSKKKRKQSPVKEEGKEVNKDSEEGKVLAKSSEHGDANDDGGNPSGSDEENMTDEDSYNQSNFDEEETGSKDDWSEEESEFDPETAEESMQSFASDKGANNSTFKDDENSFTDSENLSRTESGNAVERKSEVQPNNTDTDNNTVISRSNKRTCESPRRSDSEQLSSDSESTKSKRFKPDCPNSRDSSVNDQLENVNETTDNSNTVSKFANVNESSNEESPKESARAVLVLKRNGSSFTCIPKNNADSS